jgi:hypothetical protein
MPERSTRSGTTNGQRQLLPSILVLVRGATPSENLVKTMTPQGSSHVRRESVGMGQALRLKKFGTKTLVRKPVLRLCAPLRPSVDTSRGRATGLCVCGVGRNGAGARSSPSRQKSRDAQMTARWPGFRTRPLRRSWSNRGCGLDQVAPLPSTFHDFIYPKRRQRVYQTKVKFVNEKGMICCQYCCMIERPRTTRRRTRQRRLPSLLMCIRTSPTFRPQRSTSR